MDFSGFHRVGHEWTSGSACCKICKDACCPEGELLDHEAGLWVSWSKAHPSNWHIWSGGEDSLHGVTHLRHQDKHEELRGISDATQRGMRCAPAGVGLTNMIKTPNILSMSHLLLVTDA